MSKKRRTTRKQSGLATFMIGVAILVVLSAAVFRVSALCEKSNELSETEYSLEMKIEAANLEKQELMAQEQYMHTKQYIEDVAKDRLGLVYPDEIVIRPNE